MAIKEPNKTADRLELPPVVEFDPGVPNIKPQPRESIEFGDIKDARRNERELLLRNLPDAVKADIDFPFSLDGAIFQFKKGQIFRDKIEIRRLIAGDAPVRPLNAPDEKDCKGSFHRCPSCGHCY